MKSKKAVPLIKLFFIGYRTTRSSSPDSKSAKRRETADLNDYQKLIEYSLFPVVRVNMVPPVKLNDGKTIVEIHDLNQIRTVPIEFV
jgi:hypothetical protein